MDHTKKIIDAYFQEGSESFGVSSNNMEEYYNDKTVTDSVRTPFILTSRADNPQWNYGYTEVGTHLNGKYYFMERGKEKGFLSKQKPIYTTNGSKYKFNVSDAPSFQISDPNGIRTLFINFGEDIPQSFEVYAGTATPITIENPTKTCFITLDKKYEKVYLRSFVMSSIKNLYIEAISDILIMPYFYNDIDGISFTSGVGKDIVPEGKIITNSATVKIIDTDNYIYNLNNSQILKKSRFKIYSENGGEYNFYVTNISYDEEGNVWTFDLSDKTEFLKDEQFNGTVFKNETAIGLLLKILGSQELSHEGVDNIMLEEGYIPICSKYEAITKLCEALQCKLFVDNKDHYRLVSVL